LLCVDDDTFVALRITSLQPQPFFAPPITLLQLSSTMGKGGGSGGEHANNYATNASKKNETSTLNNGRKITMCELGEHRTPTDAWITYKGKVYDVSNWNEHPGGSVIFTHAGDDCTDIFVAFHPSSALKELDRFYIGELDDTILPKGRKNRLEPEKQRAFEKAYRELRAKMVTLGLFNSDPLYYAYKVLSNLILLSISIRLAMMNTLMTTFIGAIILGLFWQQCGWLAHDFLHHQVFKTRMYGDLMGIIIGDLFQGFSVQWWKSKHNTHHAVPNLHESSPDAADGDPDIDTMPILAWSLKMAESAKDSAFGRFMIQWQAVFYFPVLLFARLAWAHQSWVFVFGGMGQWSVKNAKLDQSKMQDQTLERIAMVGHYLCLFAILYQMSLLNALIYFLVAQTSCGLFLALVFGLGHNGMSVYPADQRPDFWKLQVSTTRNVTSNFFVDWFCGGLQYQVDHHLFPSLPRHNLAKAHELVVSFCKAEGVTYHETDMLVGTVEVLQHLSRVSREFLHEFPAM
jgi:acyl-lipid Delta6-acetylenase / acyl-lipid (9-3)-desaturase